MALDELIVARRYKFTVLERGEQFTVEGAFLGMAYWGFDVQSEEAQIVMIRGKKTAPWQSFNANRVLNIEPLD
jgi:hypothetical protein